MINWFEINIDSKIMDWDTAAQRVKTWQAEGHPVVFTNGCFDILHYGHVRYLAEARALAGKLIIGMNSGGSVSRLKGPHRPINDDLTRKTLLASLSMVDGVVIFEEDTPYELIRLLKPDVLVKGGDWLPDEIVGADIVLAGGGIVKSLPYITGYSTTAVEAKIKGE